MNETGRINIDKIEDTLDLMSSRKNDHIHICKTQNVESKKNEPFETYHFTPSALPELDFSEVSAKQTFLGHTFSYPILITGMTGGVQQGQEINEILAIVAEKYKIPMGLGSQKIMLKDPSLRKLFDVRKKAPNVFLIGNMGAVSLNYQVSLADIEYLIETLDLNAFAIHLNPLQECIQPEGERDFSNLLSKIEVLAKRLPIPIMVKEVGSGISAQTFQDLSNAGVQAIDVGGKGGTSWSAIEGMRSNTEGARLGELFRNWGLSTEEALVQCIEMKKKLKSNIELVATGGIRNGLHVAKGVALGATMSGIGLPLFRAAVCPPKGMTALECVEKEMEFFIKSLLITMFCSGAKTLSQLSSKIV